MNFLSPSRKSASHKGPDFLRELAIYIEVKSTNAEDEFTFEMSADEIRQALLKDRYYVYRVVNVASSSPKAYAYLFRDVWHSGKVKLDATKVMVTLPKPED